MDVTADNFEKLVLEKSKETPIVVDFWAEWCMPCKRLTPILEKLEQEYGGKFILAKINIQDEENKELPGKYGVMSIPAIKMFKKGKIADEFTGALPESSVKEWLDKNL